MNTLLTWLAGVMIGVAMIYSVASVPSRTFGAGEIAASGAPRLPAPVALIASSMNAKLPLTELDVAELEKDWAANYRNAELSIESHGWRVIRLEEVSSLSRAGFHVGDLIPSERIDRSLASAGSEDNRLARRMVRALNHFSQ